MSCHCQNVQIAGVGKQRARNCKSLVVGNMNENEIITLFDGYSTMCNSSEMRANCSCVLIKGEHKIIVDTMTPWDTEKILTALANHQVQPEDIDYVISTHGHSDHIGNNNLFLKAKHIVGFSFSFRDTYFLHPFDEGKEYIINSGMKVIPTPGHTLSDVTVLVKSKDDGTVAITGDLFEKFEDIESPDIWKGAGSEDPKQQIINRTKIANLADWIIPGHGPKFKVSTKIKESLQKQAESTLKHE